MTANRTINAMEVDPQGDRFVYFAEVPSLREIASYKIALAIRYHIDSPHFFFSEKYMNVKNYEDEVDSLTASREILDLIKNSLEKIEEEFSAWINHFNNVLFYRLRRPHKILPIDANWCVWLPNGEIDYLKTGMKMLKSGKLSELQKFIVSCEYCLEDEIKKMSLDNLPSDYIANVDYNYDEILFYWIRFLKNALHEVPVEDYSSAETAIVRNFQRHARFVVEYFWHCLSDEDQLIVASEWISSRCNNHFECTVLERLISTMSWHQQRCLLAQKSEEIIINLSLHSRSKRCAIWAWEYCKDTMSDEQFAKIVDKILRQWPNNKCSCSTLTKIWETAYAHQRNHAARDLSSMIIDMCLFRDDHPAIALDFANRFLPLIPVRSKQKIISEKIFKMRTQLIDLSVLNVILDLCFLQADDKLQFQKSIMNFAWMHRHAMAYVQGGDFNNFNLLLEYYWATDAAKVPAFKRNLLRSIYLDTDSFIYLICDIDKWHAFVNFINEVYPEDPATALKYKQSFVRLFIASPVYRARFDKRLSISNTKKIVEMMFANEELKIPKHIFVRSFEESLKTRSYWENEEISDGTYLEQIFHWCLGMDARTILNVKKPLWPGIIFHRIFYRINELYQEQESSAKLVYVHILLSRLNAYLMWYLIGKSALAEFKLNKLKTKSEQPEIFKLISAREDSQILTILLKWFFDGDDEQMRTFRSENFRF